MLLNALDKSGRIAPKTFFQFTAFFHFSIIRRRQFWLPKPFRRPHWNFDRMLLKWFESCRQIKFQISWQQLGECFWSIIIFLISRPLLINRSYVSKFERCWSVWWRDCIIKLQTEFFSKKVCNFFQNFCWNVGILYCFICFCFLIFLRTVFLSALLMRRFALCLK